MESRLFGVMLLYLLSFIPSIAFAPISAQETYGLNVIYLDAIEYRLAFEVSWYHRANFVEIAVQNVSTPAYLQSIRLLQRPTDMIEDGYGNTYARYSVAGDRLKIEADIVLLGSSFIFRPEDIGSPEEIPSEIKDLYTKPEVLIESQDPSIMRKARELEEKSNIYATVKNVFDFVHSHIVYERLEIARGALWALNNKRGDCTEYSYLMVALLRALGIPSRANTGYSLDPFLGSFFAHSWVEVFLPRLGWIPFDPTWNLLASSRHIALLRHHNEHTGPFIAMADGRVAKVEVEVSSVRYIPFSDYIQVELDGSALLRRSFSKPELPSPAISIPPNQALNANVLYSTVSLRSQSVAGFVSLRYFTSTHLPLEGGYSFTIQGPSKSIVLYQDVQAPLSVDYNISSCVLGERPSTEVRAKGIGYAASSAYYISTFYLAIYTSIVVIVTAVILLRRRMEMRLSPQWRKGA